MNSVYLSTEKLSALINRTLDNTPNDNTLLLFNFSFNRPGQSNLTHLFKFMLKMTDLQQYTPQGFVDLLNSKLTYFDNDSGTYQSLLSEITFSLNNERLELLTATGSNWQLRKESFTNLTENQVNVYGDAVNIFEILGNVNPITVVSGFNGVYNSSITSVELYLNPTASGSTLNSYLKIYNAQTNDLLFSKDFGDAGVAVQRLTPELASEIQTALTASNINLTVEHVLYENGYVENRLRFSTIDASVYNLLRIESSPTGYIQTGYSGESFYDLTNSNSVIFVSLGGPDPVEPELVVDLSTLTLVYKSEHSIVDLLNGILPPGFEHLTGDSYIAACLDQKFFDRELYFNNAMITLDTANGLSFAEFCNTVWLNDEWVDGAGNSIVIRHAVVDEDGKLCIYTSEAGVVFKNNDAASQGITPLNDVYSLFSILGGTVYNTGEMRTTGDVVDCKLPNGEVGGNYIDLGQYTPNNEARDIPIKFYDFANKTYLGEVVLKSRVGEYDSFSVDSAEILNNFFIDNGIPLNAITAQYDDDWTYESIRIYNASNVPCVGILIDAVEVYVPWTYNNSVAHYDAVDGRTLSVVQLTNGYGRLPAPLAVHLVNTHAQDRKVKLVPKNEQSKIANFDGSELEMVEMDNGALGFCLAGNPCYGSTPAVAIDVNPTSTFDLTIAGTDYTGLTYEAMRSVLVANGLEVAEFKTDVPYVCTPTSIAANLINHNFTLGETIYATVMVDPPLTGGSSIPGPNETTIDLPYGMLQVWATISQEHIDYPDKAMHEMLFYSGIDLARQFNLNTLFNFFYTDSNGTPLNYNFPETSQPGSIQIEGRNVNDPVNEWEFLTARSTSLKFIPTPSEYKAVAGGRDWVVETFGEEGIEVLSCAQLESEAS